MKYTLMMGGIALATGFAMTVTAAEQDATQNMQDATQNIGSTLQQQPLVTETLEHNATTDSVDSQPQKSSSRCKLYQSGTRKHLRAHNIVGNPDPLNCK